MKLSRRKKLGLLLAGDVAALYLSLIFMLMVRYGGAWQDELIRHHALPFTFVFISWVFVFYIAGLYDLRRLRNNLDFFKTVTLTLFINALLAVGFFYLIPVFGIAPKTNLLLFIGIFAALEFAWRRIWNYLTVETQSQARMMLVGGNGAAADIMNFLRENRQLGYETALHVPEEALPPALGTLRGWQETIKENRIDLVVIPAHFKKESLLTKIFYELLAGGLEIHDIPHFYETVFRKVNLSQIDETWFLEKITARRRFYDDLKRAAEFLAALILQTILLPLEIVIAICITLASPGPAIYAQTRVGQRNRTFTLYKFRTMNIDAEKHGAEWAKEYDARTTGIGRLLRHTHLDELPQLINILMGDLSFVGPRPERPEFITVLEEKIPYYEIRHLVKPGITGWAQINFRYGASIDDAYEKLQYDVYYIKNRSLILDLAIVLKTIRLFFLKNK